MFGSSSAASAQAAEQEESLDGKSISSGDSDVDILGAEIAGPEPDAEAEAGANVHAAGVQAPKTPEGCEPSTWEPPAHLDLRLCEQCNNWSYLRKKACVNSDCVFQLQANVFLFLNSVEAPGGDQASFKIGRAHV